MGKLRKKGDAKEVVPAKVADDAVRLELEGAAKDLLNASRRLRAVAAGRPQVELFAEEVADVMSRVEVYGSVLGSHGPAEG